MPDDIAFLHTAAVHVATFTKLTADIAPTLRQRHIVDTALLSEAQRMGASHPETVARVHAAMHDAGAGGARVVVCTCSTIGASAETAFRESPHYRTFPGGAGKHRHFPGVKRWENARNAQRSDRAKPQEPVLRTLLSAHGGFVPLRIDRAMADRAVTLGPRVLVLAALDSTLAPTRQLLDSSRVRANVSIEARYLVVAGAWAHFLADDYPAYHAAIARQIVAEAPNADVIVLAQASMAPAAELAGGVAIEVLSSPRLGVQHAVRCLHAGRG